MPDQGKGDKRLEAHRHTRTRGAEVNVKAIHASWPTSSKPNPKKEGWPRRSTWKKGSYEEGETESSTGSTRANVEGWDLAQLRADEGERQGNRDARFESEP